MCNRAPRPLTLSWWNSAPGFWLSMLVPAILALAVILWAWGAFSAEVKPLIPQDLPAAEHLLRQHSIFGRVIEGKLVKEGETQTLVCEVMVAPGNIQTVVIRLVGEKKTNE